MTDERDFEQRYSACFLDFTAKASVGAIIGMMLGGFFLKNKKWPGLLGGGGGFGMAYANCEKSLNQYLHQHQQPDVCRTLKKQMEKRTGQW